MFNAMPELRDREKYKGTLWRVIRATSWDAGGEASPALVTAAGRRDNPLARVLYSPATLMIMQENGAQ